MPAAFVIPPRRRRLAPPCVIAAFVLSALAGPFARSLAAATPPDTTIKVDTLGAGIYVFRAPSDLDKWTATNVVVCVNDEDVVVFDSNTRRVTVRKVIDAIRGLTNKPVRMLINSHWHQDHWSGNGEYLKAFPGVEIVATTETRDYMKRMGGAFFAHGLKNSAKRQRASLDSAQRSGKTSEGKPLTDSVRRAIEADIAESADFAAEIEALPRVLPNMVYRDTLVFWRGRREFRLISVVGDATGSTVLYLPNEKLLVTGDVLVRPEAGDGPPPWTTNSYAITPWLQSLRRLEALDIATIVPGQGIVMRDRSYLAATADVFEAIITQVHAALERGLQTFPEVRAAVNVDAIGMRYTPGAATLSSNFNPWVDVLVRKVIQESFDGVSR
jgi:glyoxylase-like metal-dependent hydrolase (beta-lactamase superfamily II)